MANKIIRAGMETKLNFTTETLAYDDGWDESMLTA